jgi:hypothetical protein
MKHLSPDLRKIIQDPFDKKPEGVPRCGKDDRVGGGLKFPHPEDLVCYMHQRAGRTVEEEASRGPYENDERITDGC